MPSSASGWDPYDVWSTRVRSEQRPVAEPLAASVPHKGRDAATVLTVVFVLLIVLGLGSAAALAFHNF